MLFSLTGCGNAAAQSPVPVKESTGNIDTAPILRLSRFGFCGRSSRVRRRKSCQIIAAALTAHGKNLSDDGIWQYDIEFHKDTTEYDYDIDALTGEVLSFDHDAEYYHHAQADNAGSEQITEEQAKQLALQHAGVAEKDAQRLQIKFDYDDGRGEYEVEWSVGRTDPCEILYHIARFRHPIPNVRARSSLLRSLSRHGSERPAWRLRCRCTAVPMRRRPLITIP